MALTVEIEKQLGNFHLRAAFTSDQSPMALLGGSGSGKSVTLQCIAGLMRPDRGRIELDDTVLFDSDARIDLPPQKRLVGYLFQQYALFPHMTLLQNVAAAGGHGSRRERLARARALLTRFHLEGFEGYYPRQLSGGQQQRAALARILAAQPRAILLDEPFSALDRFLQWELELTLEEILSDFPGTVLWVSHDREEVHRHCRRVAVIDHGTVGGVKTMDALLSRPATVAEARLAGCRNLAACTVSGGILTAPDWALSLPWDGPDGAYTLAIPDPALRWDPHGPLRGTVIRAMADSTGVKAQIALPHGGTLTAPLPSLLEAGTEAAFDLAADQLLVLRDPGDVSASPRIPHSR